MRRILTLAFLAPLLALVLSMTGSLPWVTSPVLAEGPTDKTATHKIGNTSPSYSTRILGPATTSMIRVLTFTGDRARSDLVLGSGANSSNLNTALANPANFGPTGVVTCGLQITYVPSIATGTMVSNGTRNYDIFYSAELNDNVLALTGTEAAELTAFLNAGGIVSISGDSGGGGLKWNPLFTALGIADQFASFSTGSDGTAAPLLTTPITSGPFGTVGTMDFTPYSPITTSTLNQVVKTDGGAYTLIAEHGFGSGYLSAIGDSLQHDVNTVNYEDLRYYLNLFALGCSTQMADVSITGQVSVGSMLKYTFTVINNGPSPAAAVQFSNTLPIYLKYGSVITTKGTCTGGATVSCKLGNLAPGQSVTITVNTFLKTSAIYTLNTAQVSSTTFDPNMANNTATVTH